MCATDGNPIECRIFEVDRTRGFLNLYIRVECVCTRKKTVTISTYMRMLCTYKATDTVKARRPQHSDFTLYIAERQNLIF